MDPIANDGAASPLLTVLDTVSGAHAISWPTVAASYTAAAVTVPQLAVGAGNVNTIPLALLVGLVPVAAGHVVALLVTATRAYDPPVTSVPEASTSVGLAVYRAM